jgi:lysozyme
VDLVAAMRHLLRRACQSGRVFQGGTPRHRGVRLLHCVAAATAALVASLCPVVAAGALATPSGWPALSAGESYGVDVASYQGSIAWPELAADDIGFAYIKATEGATYVNPYFTVDWEGSASAGIAHGAYHFYSLCSTGVAQAQRFLATVPKDPDALPPALDLELRGNCAARPGANALNKQILTFVSLVQAVTGKQVVFYVGLDFSSRYKLAVLSNPPVWSRQLLRPLIARIVIWQTTSTVSVTGINGVVDLDLARLSTLRSLLT